MKNSLALRLWMAVMAALIWLGIYCTGLSKVHWLLLLPAIGLIVASATGFCPSFFLINKIIKRRQNILSK